MLTEHSPQHQQSVICGWHDYHYYKKQSSRQSPRKCPEVERSPALTRSLFQNGSELHQQQIPRPCLAHASDLTDFSPEKALDRRGKGGRWAFWAANLPCRVFVRKETSNMSICRGGWQLLLIHCWGRRLSSGADLGRCRLH